MPRFLRQRPDPAGLHPRRGNDFAVFWNVCRAHGLPVAAIKALARFARRRVLVEGLDTDFPRPAVSQDLAMPTMDDAGRWHTGYGGRWKHVLPLPNERMMLHVGAASVDNFFFVADAWAQILSRYIAPHSHVMDVGCGCGRTARMLVNNPHVQRFTGFDVFAPYVEWCARFFGELHPQRFSFYHLDVRTERYNPGGSLSCATAHFPAPDHDVDVVYAASVFTHLYLDDLHSYVREMRRVLKPSGVAVISFHIIPRKASRFPEASIAQTTTPTTCLTCWGKKASFSWKTLATCVDSTRWRFDLPQRLNSNRA